MALSLVPKSNQPGMHAGPLVQKNNSMAGMAEIVAKMPLLVCYLKQSSKSLLSMKKEWNESRLFTNLFRD